MGWRSSGDAYGWGARVLHWATAVLTIGLLVSGFVMRRVLTPPSAQVVAPLDLQSRLYTLHAVIGLVVTAVIVARLAVLWRDSHPDAPSLSRARLVLFRWVHRLHYVVVVALVGSGGGMLLQAYRSVTDTYLWPEREGRFIATLAIWDFKLTRSLFPGPIHRPLGWVFAALLTAHLAGVISHQMQTRDPFRRMLWRRKS